MASPHFDYWPIDGQTAVDTAQILQRNQILRLCRHQVEGAAAAVAQTIPLSHLHMNVPGAPALAAALRIWSSHIERWLDDSRQLLAARERAAQIFATAEQSVEQFFAGCRAAEFASCGGELPEIAYRLGRFSLLPLFLIPGILLASPQYISTMTGKGPGTGGESLLAQNQVHLVDESTKPFGGKNTYVGQGFESLSGLFRMAPKELDWGLQPRTGALSAITGVGAFLLGAVSSDKVVVAGRAAGGGPIQYRVANHAGTVWSGWGSQKPPDRDGGSAWSAGEKDFAPRPNQIIATPISPSELVGQMNTSGSSGEIEILRHQTGDDTSWSVVIRGTKEIGLRGAAPHDLLTNLQEVRGDASVQQVAVQSALEMAGAKSGDVVELVGHSQGGIVAANMAADSDFTRKYQVSGVITAGAPTGNAGPTHVPVLAFENLNDVIPSLDGMPNQQADNYLTVHFSPRSSEPVMPHSATTYQAAIEQIEQEDVGVQQWAERRKGDLRLGPETTTTRLHFETRRAD